MTSPEAPTVTARWCQEVLVWAAGRRTEPCPVDLATLDAAQWAALLQAAALHRVLGQCVDASSTVPRLPAATAALVRHLRSSARVEACARATGYDAVLDDLAGSGVRPVVLKGVVLSRQCYDELHHRPFSDLDVLVSLDELDPAADALRRAGFEQAEVDAALQTTPISSARQDGYRHELQHLAEFTRRDTVTGQLLSVDLHFRLATAFDHVAPDVEQMLAAAVPVPGQRWSTLAPADFVTHLCYHAWWDGQSVDNVRRLRDLRLFQLADIARAMRSWDLSCGTVLTRARELGVGEIATWGMVTAAKVLGPIRGDGDLDEAVASRVGRAFADRWVQRSTGTPLATWSTDSWDRIFDEGRADDVLAMLWDGWVDPRLRAGDVLSWRERAAGG